MERHDIPRAAGELYALLFKHRAKPVNVEFVIEMEDFSALQEKITELYATLLVPKEGPRNADAINALMDLRAHILDTTDIRRKGATQ